MYNKHRLFVLLFLALAALFATIHAIANQHDVLSVSQRATVSFRRSQGLESLSTADDTHQIELRTTLGRGFVLDLKRHDSPITSPNYEEVIHDVSKSTSNKPHLTVTRSTHTDLNRCLYHGKVSGDERSVVTLNTCTGELTGLIHLSTGELFSIEPTTRLQEFNGRGNSKTVSSPSSRINAQSLSNLRALALNGDLKSLSENTPEVLLIDVNAEAKLEDEFNGRLNSHIDAQSTGKHSTSCASDSEIHHPPAHVLRKAGLNNDDIRTIIQPLGDDQPSNIEPLQSDLSYPDRYVEILLYHDNARLRRFKTDPDMTQEEIIAAAREDGIALFNNIKTYYLNSGFRHTVNAVLLGHVFFANGDPYTKYLARDGGTMVISNYGLLENFNKYRNAYGHNNHDVGVLLSGNRFQSNIMGVANIGSICGGARYNGNINSITYRNIVKSSVLSAHEIGHSLGSQHDNGSGYIMYPYVSSDTTFSPQSVRSIDYYFSRTRCTINNPETARELDVDNNEIQVSSLSSLSVSTATAPPRSLIYTQNINPEERFDGVNQSLIQDGILSSADYHLPDDEPILFSTDHTVATATEIMQEGAAATTTTKASSTTTVPLTTLLTVAGCTAAVACGLTSAAIFFVLRALAKNKDFQNLWTGQKELPTVSQERSIPKPREKETFDFTPQRLQRQNQQQEDPTPPITPRDAPASPSFSESARHRARIAHGNDSAIIHEVDAHDQKHVEDLRPIQ